MKISLLKKEQGLAGIWQTMYLMRDIVYRSIRERIIKDTAVNLIRNIEPTKYLEQVKKIFSFIRKKVKYVKDYFGIEEIQYPSRLLSNILKKGYAYGDCDDMAILVASMLYSIGLKTRFCVIATKPKVYNHIRTEVLINNKWIPLELASTKLFGDKIETKEKPLYLEI